MNADLKDSLTGVIILALGAATAAYSATQLPFGALRAPGPGFFPACLGVVLFLLGSVIAVNGVLRGGAHVYARKPDFRALLMIAISIVAFIIGLKYFGLVIAIVASTVVSSLADNKLKLINSVLLGLGLAGLAAVTFRFGLGMYIPLVDFPF